MAADGTIFVEIDPTGAVVGARRVKKSLDEVGTAAERAGKKASRSKKAFSSIATGLVGPLGLAAAAASVAIAMRKVVDVTRDFQKTVSELSAITGATGDDLKFLSDQAKLLGRTTTLTASEVATGFKLIASAKPDLLESGEALTEVTRQAITLAEAAGITLPDAAIALAGSLNQFQAEADQASRFINVLAAGSKRGAAEIPDLTQSLKAAGTVAASAGLSFEATIANIETLAEVNLKGAESGTALRNVILFLQKEGVDKLNPAVVGLTTALENLNAEGRSDVEILEIFGLRNFAAAKALLARTERTRELEKAITGTLTAEEQALINTDNLEGKTKALGSAIEGLSLAFGEVLLPSVESTTSFFTNYINTLTDALNKTIEFTSGISNAVGEAVDSNQSFLDNVADKSIEEIEDRIRKENLLLNDLLEFAASDAAGAISGATLGLSAAFSKGDIQDAERFIALLKQARNAKLELSKKTGGKTEEELAEEAEVAAFIKAQEAKAKALEAAEKKRKADAEQAKRDAIDQQKNFASLADSLQPYEAALRELNEAEEVLQKQRALGLITDEEQIVLQGQLTDAFKEALDPIGALNQRLKEEKELAALSASEKQIELRVQREVNALKKAGVEDADDLAESIRKEATEIQRLNEEQTKTEETTEVVNEKLERQKEILEELRGPQEDMNLSLAALNQLLADDAITLEEFNDKLESLRLRTLEGQTTVEAGFERGFIKAQANLNDFASLSEKIVKDSFQGMEDGIVDFVKTGKTSFSGLVDSILEDLVRLAAKKAIVDALGTPPGKEGGGGSGLFGFLGGLGGASAAPGGPPGTSGGGKAAQVESAAGFAVQLASLFSSNADGGIERTPTISTLAEKGPEAIIPLKGGKVPVDIKEPSKPPINVNNVFNISTPDVQGFGRSTGQVGQMMGLAFNSALQRNG